MNQNKKISMLRRIIIYFKRKKNARTKYFYINMLVVALFLFVFLYKYDFNVNVMLHKIDITLFSIIVSFFAVIMQMNSNKMISTASNDLELQKAYVDNKDFAILFMYCWNKIEKKNKNVYKKLKNIPDYRITLLNYFTFFESVYLMYKKGVVNIKLLDDLFGRRFFVVVNDKEVQKEDLLSNWKYYKNIGSCIFFM